MTYRNQMTIFGVGAVLEGLLILIIPAVAYFPRMPFWQWPTPVAGDMAFWQGVAFVRMFAALMIGYGGLIFELRRIKEMSTQRSVTSALIFANSVIFLIALCQLESIWSRSSFSLGITLSFSFFGSLVAFIKLRFVELGDKSVSTSLSRTERLQSAWEKQIRATAAQEERNRLARDLHDSIKQQVFTINISAATAQARLETDAPGALRALDDLRQGAREAMTEMEALLQHLRPAPLENVGLIEAIRKQCEALQYRTGAQVVTEFGELPESKRLQPGAQEAIFRITQESLANIARHARAENVRVRLHQTDDRNGSLWLKISDDGKGFDTTSPPAGLGLTNIRERAQEIGGRLALESSPGSGTQMILEIPLKESELLSVKKQIKLAAGLTFLSALLLFIGFQLDSDSALTFYSIAPIMYIVGLYRLINAHRRINQLAVDADISRSAVAALRRSTFQVFAFLYTVLLLASLQQVLAHAHNNGNQYSIAFLFLAMGVGVPIVEQLRQVRKYLIWNPASDTGLEIQRKLIGIQRQALRNVLLPLPFFYLVYRMTGNWIVFVFAAGLMAWSFYLAWERRNRSLKLDEERFTMEARQ
jgi:signal transduction histidine kinase